MSKSYGSTSDANKALLNEHEEKEENKTHNITARSLEIVIKQDRNEDRVKEEEEVDKTFVLELPRSILTAYIIIQINNDWNRYTLRGKIGILFAVAIPLFIQGLATVSLAAGLDWMHLKIETDAEELIYNIAALSALFIYMFNDIRALTQSTWYYLGRIEKEANVLWDADAITDRMQNFDRIKSNLTALATSAPSLIPRTLMEARNNINYLHFRVLIGATVAMYIVLTFYGLMQMNQQKALVNKLDVALSIFIILEVDDWAYKLFIVQNRILEDSEFDITLVARHDSREQQDWENSITKKETGLWYSILIVLFLVAAIVVASGAYNLYEMYIK
eukprot:254052_1